MKKVEVVVVELLFDKKFLGSYNYGPTSRADVAGICPNIINAKDKRETLANRVSSRTHILITFEGLANGRRGDEESVNHGLLSQEQMNVSSEISKNNSDLE